MSLNVRRYDDVDDVGFRHIRAMAYRGGEAVSPDDKLLRSDCIAFVAEEDGKIVGATTAVRMTASKSGLHLPCAGLAAVGVLPEKRRSGVGSAMMNQIIPMLREEGFVLASLYPFRASYYRKFDYAYCGKRYKIHCPAERLPRLKGELSARQIASSDRQTIYDCYAHFAGRYSGMNSRNEDQWWRVLGGDTPLQIYAVGDPVEGYAVLRLSDSFWGPQSVKELVWNTNRAYRSLLSFFHSLSVNKTSIDWREPGDSPFYTTYFDQGASLSATDDVMFRIVNLPAAVKSLRPTGEGRLDICISDHADSTNRGAWRICFGNGEAQIERTAAADLQVSCGQLTQMFLGEPSFESMANSRVLETSTAEMEAGLLLFPSQRTYCMDYF